MTEQYHLFILSEQTGDGCGIGCIAIRRTLTRTAVAGQIQHHPPGWPFCFNDRPQTSPNGGVCSQPMKQNQCRSAVPSTLNPKTSLLDHA
jgi:hypothetical protein